MFKNIIAIGVAGIDDVRKIEPIRTEIFRVPLGTSLLPYLQEKLREVCKTADVQAFFLKGGSFSRKRDNLFQIDFYNNIPEEILEKWKLNEGGK